MVCSVTWRFEWKPDGSWLECYGTLTTTSYKIVEKLAIHNSFSFLKSLLMKNLRDITHTPSRSPFQSCSTKSALARCTSSKLHKRGRGKYSGRSWSIKAQMMYSISSIFVTGCRATTLLTCTYEKSKVCIKRKSTPGSGCSKRLTFYPADKVPSSR